MKRFAMFDTSDMVGRSNGGEPVSYKCQNEDGVLMRPRSVDESKCESSSRSYRKWVVCVSLPLRFPPISSLAVSDTSVSPIEPMAALSRVSMVRYDREHNTAAGRENVQNATAAVACLEVSRERD